MTDSLPISPSTNIAGLSRRRFMQGAAVMASAPLWALTRPTAASALSAALVPRPARSADQLANMLGVVVVTSTTSHPVWGNRALVRARLQELGVRFIRDRVYEGNTRQIEWLQQLGAAGIRLNAIIGEPTMTGGTPEQLVNIAATSLTGSIATFEGANEWNLKGRPNWAQELRAHQGRLYRAAKGNARTAGFPVLGPSLGMRKGYTELGNLTGSLDRGTVHLYTGGWQPSNRTDDELSNIRIVAGTKPVMVTETGFHNARNTRSTHPYTPENIAGIYAPRLLLEYFIRGVQRIFLYHLVDERANPSMEDHESHFGLLRNDFSRKPAFNSLANFQALLSGGVTAAPSALSYEVRNSPSDLRQALVRRSDGTYVLFLWRDVCLWDPIDQRTLAVPARSVTVALGRAANIRTFQPSTSGTAMSARAAAMSATVPLAGEVVALELDMI